jgi:hypothetical protein
VITKNAGTIFYSPLLLFVVGSEILVRESGWIKSGPVIQIKHSGSEILDFYLMLRFFGRRRDARRARTSTGNSGTSARIATIALPCQGNISPFT